MLDTQFNFKMRLTVCFMENFKMVFQLLKQIPSP